MAIITLTEISPTGSDLFVDSESYLNSLTQSEVTNLKGASGLVSFATGVLVSGAVAIYILWRDGNAYTQK